MSELKPITQTEREIANLIEIRNNLDRTIEALKATLPNGGRRNHAVTTHVFKLDGKTFELEA